MFELSALRAFMAVFGARAFSSSKETAAGLNRLERRPIPPPEHRAVARARDKLPGAIDTTSANKRNAFFFANTGALSGSLWLSAGSYPGWHRQTGHALPLPSTERQPGAKQIETLPPMSRPPTKLLLRVRGGNR
jgi:hypothetical protein